LTYASIEAAMMFASRAWPPYSPLPRSPSVSGGAIRTAAPIVSVPAERVDVVGQQSRVPVEDPGQALSTARYNASIAPLPSAEARHLCSPEVMTTAPRLRMFEPR
jgi:hypothetical protein